MYQVSLHIYISYDAVTTQITVLKREERKKGGVGVANTLPFTDWLARKRFSALTGPTKYTLGATVNTDVLESYVMQFFSIYTLTVGMLVEQSRGGTHMIFGYCFL